MIHPNKLYPLKDPKAYDDDLGKGYTYVLFYIEEPANYTISDGWIVNEKGQRHPGYDQSPVPIHIDDVDFDNIIDFAGDLPTRAHVFSGFRQR